MPTTDQHNPDGDLILTYPAPVVSVSNNGAAPNTEAQEVDFLYVESVEVSAGGRTLDHVNLKWRFSGDLTNRSQPNNFQSMVSVNLQDDEKTRLVLTDYVSETEKVDTEIDLSAQGQLREYHFGNPCPGQRWYKNLTPDGVPGAGSEFNTDFQIVFNPMVDGRIVGNRSADRRRNGALGVVDGEAFADQHFVWLSPANSHNASSLEVAGHSGAVEWNLVQAILAVCAQCNLYEDFIRNPTEIDLVGLGSAPPLRDVRLPVGKYLPEMLDALLLPYDYNWTVDYQTGNGDNANDKTRPKIRIFGRGTGTQKTIRFQSPGQNLDLEQTNCNEYTVSRSIGESVNEVTVLGDFPRYEITMLLQRGWSESEDSLTASQLSRTSGDAFITSPNAHRLWVGNEGGDHMQLRSVMTVPQLAGHINLLGENEIDSASYWPRRRQLYPPLTYLDPDTKDQRPIYVEFSTDGGSTWNEVPDEWGEVLLMPDQIAVYFNADVPPTELIEAGDDARVRVTGTIKGDYRLKHTISRPTNAVNGRNYRHVVDAAQKFQFTHKLSGGDFGSVLEPPEFENIDDRVAIQEYAQSVANLTLPAMVDVNVRLPGIHWSDYQIGDVITKIEGREINLDGFADISSHLYPQITRKRLVLSPSPVTELTLERVLPVAGPTRSETNLVPEDVE